MHQSSNQNVTGIVVNEKVQVSRKYRYKIRQEIYYIKKYGLGSHLKKSNIASDELKYLNKLYGKILYVLQVNPNDKENVEYKCFVETLKRQFKE